MYVQNKTSHRPKIKHRFHKCYGFKCLCVPETAVLFIFICVCLFVCFFVRSFISKIANLTKNCTITITKTQLKSRFCAFVIISNFIMYTYISTDMPMCY